MALAAISFVYFNFYGLKTLGVFGYIKSLVPSGVPGPMVPIIWFLEFFSMVIRVLTLAVRLYGNMLAGHMVLAVFSLATTVFLQQAVFSMDFVTALPAVAWFVLLVLMYAMECWWRSFRRTCSPSCPLPTSAWRFIPTDARTGGRSATRSVWHHS